MELATLFTALLAGLAGVGFAVVIGHDMASRVAERSGDASRRSERLERLRVFTLMNPSDSTAWDRYGDACRENDRPEDAIRAWETAIALSGPVQGGVDREHKIAMARRDIEWFRQNRAPLADRYSHREQVCRSCGSLVPPGIAECPRCGMVVPVDSVVQFWKHPFWRRVFRDDATGLLTRLGIGAFAIAGSLWIPWEVRGALLIALTLVLPFWWLRRFGEGA